MKNLLMIVLAISLIGVGILINKENAEKSSEKTIENAENNVGNNEVYQYEITSISGNEINGIALNKISSDNAGIFLYADELGFKVEVGDKIEVVWGEYEDEFKSIEILD